MTLRLWFCTFSVAAFFAHSIQPATGQTTNTGQNICVGYGPQSPRDISSNTGTNPQIFSEAPVVEKMNLCNIHYHRNAVHKGAGYSTPSGGKNGGYICDGANSLSRTEMRPVDPGLGLMPGETIETHWVYTSCDVEPGADIASCINAKCANPTIRVESQVFLLVNDPNAYNLVDHVEPYKETDLEVPTLLTNTGEPVVYAGSLAGEHYFEAQCSSFQATWSVRPKCQKLDINSFHEWARFADNTFAFHSERTAALVTAPAMLSQIGPLPLPVTTVSGTVSSTNGVCHVDSPATSWQSGAGQCAIGFGRKFVAKPKCTVVSDAINTTMTGSLQDPKETDAVRIWGTLRVAAHNRFSGHVREDFKAKYTCTGPLAK
ncbi:MAG: delta-class carbonic anhydrase [Sulfitobacter sp.]